MTETAVIRQLPQKNKIGLFEIDATITETHNRSAWVTSNPVEDGSTINDHIVTDPKTFDINGVITNTWLVENNEGVDEGRVQQAFDILEGMFEKKELFDVQTGFKLYKNCFFTSLTMPKTRAGELRFSASFKEVVFVKTELVKISEGQLAEKDKALASTVDKGRQNPAKAVFQGETPAPGTSPGAGTEQTANITRSALKGLLGGFF